ncbi:MAG: FAD-dependent oxidoreductase, partial [Cyanobacteria bacterium P01_D01_bin.128]
AAGPSVVVIHSSPAFAAQNFDAPNLHLIGAELVSAAAESVPALANPDWAQVHRWRYAFAQQPYTRPYLISAEPLPLFCCGDWCQGATVGAALQSGLATADAFKRHINISNRQ